MRWHMGMQGYIPPKQANEQCRQPAQKALELDETLPEAHSMTAVLHISEFDWKGAENEYHRALELGPKSEQVLMSYSMYYLMPMQRLQEAVAVSRKALVQNPVSPVLHTVLGLQYIFQGQTDRGFDQIKYALELDPNYYLAYFYLGLGCIGTGKFEEGIQILETALRLPGRNSYVLGCLGAAYARIGRISEAREILEKLLTFAQKAYVPPSSFALIYTALGETERGFNWLERAVDERDLRLAYLLLMSALQLSAHPRYHALLRKMNLEP